MWNDKAIVDCTRYRDRDVSHAVQGVESIKKERKAGCCSPERAVRGLCQRCFYLSFRAIAVIDPPDEWYRDQFPCKHCGGKDIPADCFDTFCRKCADELGICVHCGARR